MFDKNNFVNFGSVTKNDLALWPLTLEFNNVLEVVEIHVHANFYQAKCSGSRVIVSTNFCLITQWWKIRKSGPVTLTFDLWPWNFMVSIVVKIHVRAKFRGATCSGSWVIVVTEEKTSTKIILSVATADSKDISSKTYARRELPFRAAWKWQKMFER